MTATTPQPLDAPRPCRVSPLMTVSLAAGAVLLTHLWMLGGPPLARTEAHRALTGHEILQTGHWLVTTLYGNVYLRKPPGFYWVVALSESILGANGWGWRVPSALASACMAAAVALMTRRWFGPRAGLIGGLSYVALVPLWAQGRSADIDALNMLASATCALIVLHLNWSGTPRPYLWAGLLALAAGAMLMVKGPAGGAPLLAALVAPSIAMRDWKPLRRAAVWLALAAGVAVFAAWAFAAWRYLSAHNLTLDLRGVEELRSRVAGRGISQWIDVAAVPAELFAFALPLSLAAILASLRPTRDAVLPDAARLARALAAALVGALVIGVLGGVNNVRYGYVALPLLCPLVGLVGDTWASGAYSVATQRLLRQVLTVTTLGYAAFAATLLVQTWRVHGDRPLLIGIAVALALATIWSVAGWLRQRLASAATGSLVVVLALGLAYAHRKNQERVEFSAQKAGLKLGKTVGQGTRVLTDRMVMFKPELFYYAQVDVDYQLTSLEQPHDLGAATWVVFHDDEWTAWHDAMPDRFRNVTPLPIVGDGAVVALYDPVPGTSPAADETPKASP
ncbi:MAG: glycosyltransferase family 39 protein [Planctomycetota bacterium]|nr:glycosyltransferase family 39 protein [Planctomycetota bacterium]